MAPARALAICEQVPSQDLDRWWDAAFRELDAALAAAAVAPAGPRAALYSTEFFTLGAGEVVAYVPITGDLLPGGRASLREIPAAELAVAVHKGSLADLDRTYGALGAHVAELEIGLADLENATSAWVHWYNTARLMHRLGRRPLRPEPSTTLTVRPPSQPDHTKRGVHKTRGRFKGSCDGCCR